MGVLSNSLPVLLAAALVGGISMHAQATPDSDLPESPGALLTAQNQAAPPPAAEPFSSSSPADGTAASPRDSAVTAVSPIYPTSHPYLHRVVKAGEGPQPLSVPQKFEMSFRSRLSYGAFGSTIFGSGERQLFNSRPHYGTDSGAFGERLGAAELNQVTESFFSYGLYASLFRQDPHYYVMGRGHGYANRAVYSASRILLTRTDSGGTAVNWSKLAGIGTAVSITNAYYPAQDRGVRQSLGAFGGNIWASVLTLELHEFMPDVMAAIRHKKQTN